MGKRSLSFRKTLQCAVLVLGILAIDKSQTQAADLPLASMSPLAGITFEDKPLILPVQRNFQMAMLTAGSELGRSCGKMEAYGWRMSQSEQGRVDQIFNALVERLRGMGYAVEVQTPNSISRDITMFTADRPNKHLLSMWSAGEIGLVMVLCETSVPPPSRTAKSSVVWSAQNTQDVVQSKLDAPSQNAIRNSYGSFSPVGTWTGTYMCGQGYTGGTLAITKMHGNNFEGTFHFYPTPKNPSVPEGKYIVFGQYDRDSQHILINPGKWLKRPSEYYNTIMVGSFDVMNRSLSAYFQGVNGCTSFEAREEGHEKALKKAAKQKAAKKAKPKKSVKKEETKLENTLPALEAPVKSGTAKPDPAGIAIPDQLKSDAVPTPAPAFTQPVPAGSAAVPAVALPPPTPANKEQLPAAAPAAPAPAPAAAPAPTGSAAPVPQPAAATPPAPAATPAVPDTALPPSPAPTTKQDAK